MGSLERHVREPELCPKGTGEPWRVFEQEDRVRVLEVSCQGMGGGWPGGRKIREELGVEIWETGPEVDRDQLVAGCV